MTPTNSCIVTIEPATSYDLPGTYCAVVVADDTPHLFHHVAQSEIRTHPCYQAFQLESYLGTPLFVDGVRYGTLNFSSPDPGAPFASEDVDTLCLMAQWLGGELARAKHAAELDVARKQATEANRAPSRVLA